MFIASEATNPSGIESEDRVSRHRTPKKPGYDTLCTMVMENAQFEEYSPDMQFNQ